MALEQRRRVGRRLEAEMSERVRRRDAAARSPLEEPPLEQVGLVDVLDRVLLPPHGHGQRRQADRTAAELLADRAEDLAVEAIETEMVDLQLRERRVGDRCR